MIWDDVKENFFVIIIEVVRGTKHCRYTVDRQIEGRLSERETKNKNGFAIHDNH